MNEIESAEKLEDGGRTLRVKERRQYTEDCLQDEEIEGKRMFSVEEKLVSDRFGQFFVKEMSGNDFNLKYLQENGFEVPVVFKEKTGLGMRIPSENFTVNDVRQCVGSRRMLDVMDVTTQKDIEMSMKDWCRYFENTTREKLLNVISLEFSHTKLENYIESPSVVRQVDWVDLAWPRYLKESQTEATNSIDDMKYPKVQKYCLMSVKGCYTDFHIDFGGTSVWYHILRGQKVFWLIPPTDHNLRLYEDWVLSGKQGDVFFGDTVEKCAKVHLHAGYTFLIPTGWIHAVYTPEDSLVFGGNFLHSFGMEKQIRIAEIEDSTHVPVKFRYPFFNEIMWYVMQRYVFCLMGKNHLICNENGDVVDSAKSGGSSAAVNSSLEKEKENVNVVVDASTNTEASPGLAFSTKAVTEDRNFQHPPNGCRVPPFVDPKSNADAPPQVLNGFSEDKQLGTSRQQNCSLSKKGVYLTKFELNGLKTVVQWLQRLPQGKKNVPDLIRDADALMNDVKMLLYEHRDDDPSLAVTGDNVIYWSEPFKKPVRTKPRPSGPSTKQSKSGSKGSASSARRRRTRCKKCEACLRADCGDCHFCKDMKKFGGPGRMKQSCISRQCMAPVLPHTACCMICGRDGWEKMNNPQENETSSLMECSQCWEIVHPACLRDKNPDLPLEGQSTDDLPNSWECPKCCRDGKPDQVKPRHMKSGKSQQRQSLPLGNLDNMDHVVLNEPSFEDVQMNEMHPNLMAVCNEDRETDETGPFKKKTKLDEEIQKSEFIKHKVANSDDVRALPAEIRSPKSLQKHCESSDDREEEESGSEQRLDSRNFSDALKQKPLLHSPPHVRSCARFTLSEKTHLKSDTASAKADGKLSSTKSSVLELRPRLGSKNILTSKKHGETARERLFRNMKGLKKKSELLRHNVLQGKSKTLGDNYSLHKESSANGKSAYKGSDSKSEANANRVVHKRVRNRSSSPEGNADEKMPLKHLSNTENSENYGKSNADKNAPSGLNRKFNMTLRDKQNLKKPKYVVRPAPILEGLTEKKRKSTENNYEDLALEKEVMLPVFRYLQPHDLYNCQLVCKSWNRWCIDPRLWTTMNLTRCKLTADILVGIVRRQPVSLNLSWTSISRRQLAWLSARLPQLKDLVISGTAASSVTALCSSNCPLLRSLDLSWTDGLIDSVIRELLSPPPDSRPGFVEAKTRLRQLMEVRVAGADISDVSVRLMAHHLPLLSRLDLSHCHKVTDMGIAVLGAAKSARLTHLDVSSCSNISDTSLEALKRCTNLMLLDMRDCPQVTEPSCQKFVSHYRNVLSLKDGKFMERIS